MQLETIKPKSGRIRIERAIYQNLGNKKYVIVSYSKISKKTRNLAEFEQINDARVWRDTNLRFAKYGKGIQMRKVKNGYKFDSEIMIYNKNTDKTYNVRVGTFNSPEEARVARIEFIENLK